ncbi:peptide ABC transporter substrate-binding protein [Luteimonas sp. FXH3W]|uniref:Peptide ABC transporter substrate-binding protein n=1 Tax=Aquilutibacter rugosus TaxID=3115820 RepID=A0ABU7UWL6_9GAMM
MRPTVPALAIVSRRLPLLLSGVGLALSLWSSGLHAATLQRGNGPEPATLDAHKCQEVACGNILRDLYEGLVTESASGQLIPGTAQSWTVSADGLRWTFHLRPNLRWSNGKPLDAPQIVAGFRRAFTPETAAPFAELFDAVHNAALVTAGRLPVTALGITSPDARTVQFQLDRSANLPALLILPIAMPVYLPAVQAHGARFTQPGNLVSNGAYALEAWTPQANLTLVRNAQFHDAAKVRMERVRFHVTEDAAAELQRFAAGDLHLTEVVPPQPLPALRKRFGSQLRISPYIGSFYLGLNLTQAPFKGNPRLRQALSMAVDRDLLTRYVAGLGEQPAFGIVPPGISGYTPAVAWWSVGTTQAQRAARARKLYREAGYSAERPLEIELRYNTSTPHRRLALAVAAMWRDTLGVRAHLRNEEWKVFVNNRKQRVITQVFRGGWIADVPDPRNFLVGYGQFDNALNWSGLNDPAFTERLARSDRARNEKARLLWLRAAETRLLNQDAVIPLYYYTSKHLVASAVRGFEANALDHHASRWLDLQP